NKYKEAILLNEKLITEYKGHVHEKNGLMNLFFIYYDAQDYKSAELSLARIDKAYSNNEEVMLANWLLNKGKADITKPHESVVSETTLPVEYSLSANYPNPFNPNTIINYNIPNDGFVSLKIYDILGKEVADLINDVRSAGSYNVEFNASNLASGVYIYRIQVNSKNGGYTASKKMLLTK
ncbi:MAG: T9SS type A sorting domain-containing protein, partial [Ignavibacteriaceae bacterium]